MKCPKCSFEVGDNTKSCPECGEKLLEATADVAESTEVQAAIPAAEEIVDVEKVNAKKKKRKKIIKIIIISASVIAFCWIIFAIIWSWNPNCCFYHNSNNEEWIVVETVAPTCSEKGYELLECAYCGESDRNYLYDDQNKPTGKHDWEISISSLTRTCKTCQKKENVSAFDVLNEDERAVYRCLISLSNNLKNPASLRLLDLKVGPSSAYSTEDSVFVKVSATNSFGGTVTDVYVCEGSWTTTAGSAWYDVAGAWYHIGSVSRINAALDEALRN